MLSDAEVLRDVRVFIKRAVKCRDKSLKLVDEMFRAETRSEKERIYRRMKQYDLEEKINENTALFITKYNELPDAHARSGIETNSRAEVFGRV